MTFGHCEVPSFFKPYLFPLNQERASPGQDDSGGRAGLPKGPPLPLHHWFNEGFCVKGGEIGEEVYSLGKVTKETKGIPSSSVIASFIAGIYML
jgi:hypothetical protein